MSAPNPTEIALANLIHDLRQPLGNIESSVWCLRSFLATAEPRVQEQAALIGRQVEEAARLLAAAAEELRRATAQRGDAAVNLEVTNSAS